VNNAGIALKFLDPLSLEQQVAPTISLNYFGTVDVIHALLPLLRESPSPRIVNVASKKHNLTILPTEERRKQFASPKLQVDELNSLMREFVTDVESGDPTKILTWPKTTYGMSKLGMVTLTNVLARQEPKIMINVCCPGFCATDMSSHKGTKTSEEGARTPAMVALLPEELKCTGKFFSDEKEVTW
jgi:carbonyl reductase 1